MKRVGRERVSTRGARGGVRGKSPHQSMVTLAARFNAIAWPLEPAIWTPRLMANAWCGLSNGLASAAQRTRRARALMVALALRQVCTPYVSVTYRLSRLLGKYVHRKDVPKAFMPAGPTWKRCSARSATGANTILL